MISYGGVGATRQGLMFVGIGMTPLPDVTMDGDWRVAPTGYFIR